MRQSLAWALVVVFVFAANVSLAQDETTNYVFGAYYSCDQSRESWSDTITENFIAPIIDSHIKEGGLSGWGRMAHNLGGEWRRVQYFGSSDLNALLDTRSAIIEAVQSDAAAAGREVGDICPDHDDYIWMSVIASRPLSEELSDRPEATYSTYFECDTSRQARADEIFRQVYAPVYQQAVANGRIQSWTWFAHVVGGKYRRLLTYSGSDHKSLLAVANDSTSSVRENHPDLASEFASICGSHDDYLWNVVISRP